MFIGLEFQDISVVERRFLVAMSDDLAATSCGDSLLFWDLNYRIMIRRVLFGILACKRVHIPFS